MSERLPCSNPGCDRTILPATAAKTGGLCMPCVQQRKREEHVAYILANRRDVDPYAGVTDPLELIKLIHQPRPHDPLENVLPPPRPLDQLYSELTSSDAAKLVGYAVERVEQEDLDQAESLARCLAAFTEADLTPLLQALVDRGRVYPYLAFSRASDSIRDRLIRRVEQDAAQRNALLCALAWIGDATVAELFAKWKQRPPSWAVELHIPPEDYALEAGWELSPGHERRDLFYRECYALVPRAGEVPSPVSVVTEDAEPCGWCGRPMVALVSLDLADPRLSWLSSKGTNLAVRTCTSCTCYGHLFTHAETAKRPAWHARNLVPENLPDASGDWELPSDRLELARELRSPFYAADQFLPTRFSQLGGHPTWIQDSEFPRCPDCDRRMMFIAQVSVEDLVEPSEGMYYAFLCHECLTAATGYQQT